MKTTHAERILSLPVEEVFQRLVSLAVRILDAPRALVAFTEDGVVRIQAQIGLPEHRLHNPLDHPHTVTQFVLEARAPVAVEDFSCHEWLSQSVAYLEDGTLSCVAVPLRTSSAEIVGAFIVSDTRQRHWLAEDIEILESLAATAMAELEARNLAREAESERREKSRVLEAISDAFFTVDARFHYSGCNRQGRILLEEVLNLKEEDLQEKTIWEAFPLLFGTTVYDAIVKAREEHTSTSFETFLDSVNRWYAGRVYWVDDGLALFVSDVTERRTAEDALEESEERFRSAFENAPIGMSLTSLDGCFFRVNRALAELLGYEPREMLGHSFQDFTIPEDVDISREAITSLVSGQVETVQFEKRYLHKEGHEVTVLLESSMVRNNDGQPAYLITQIMDMTQQRQAHENLKLLSKVASESLSSIIVTDAEEHIVFVNPAFEKMTGYTLDEVQGKRPGDALRGPLSPESARATLREAIRAHRPVVVESINYRKDGTHYDVEMRIVPVLDADGICTHFIGLANDITERKQAERDLLVSEERFRMLADNARDIVFYYRLSPEPRFEYLSPSITSITGYTAEEHYADPMLVRRLLMPEDRRLFSRLRKGVCESETVLLRWKRKDGSLIWIELAYHRVFDRDGTVIAVDGIARDVTERMKSDEALRQSEAKHRALLQAIPDLLFRVRRDGVFVEYISDIFSKSSTTLAELEGLRLKNVLPDPVARKTIALIQEVLDTGEMRIFETSLPMSGRMVPFEARILPSGPDEVLIMARDQGDRKRADVALERYRLLSGRIHDILLFVKPDGQIVDVNDAAIKAYGYTRHELVQMNIKDLRSPAHRASLKRDFRKALKKSTLFETVHVRKDGSCFDVEVSSQSAEVDGELMVISLIRDISERKSMEQQLLHQALHDPLTGLPNRALFGDRLEHALTRCSRNGETAAVLFLDLDRFKVVNDSLGHGAGDRLLIAAASRMRSCLRAEDTIARFGGDEFTILLEGIRDEGEATRLATRILRRLQTAFSLNGEEAFVTASIGIAIHQGMGSTADDIMQQADLAMYQAKNSGRGRYVVFKSTMSGEAQERLRLEVELRRAIERDQFRVMYQPIIVMETGQIIGVEALVRWQHPRFGLMPPDDFVPLQEQIGLIEPFTLWVLREAQKQCLLWHAAGYHLSVSVNLSPYNLQDPSFPDHVASVLAETGLTPSWLKLEITESAVMMNPAQAIDSLRRLSEMGVRLSMDDFGTGYSSLSYLKQLPVHEVKIDKSFVAGMDERDEDDTAIVRAIIDLAHNLRKKVVAEGVESPAVWDLLYLLGCDAAQGYYMGRPMLSENLMEWLENSQWGMQLPHLSPTSLNGMVIRDLTN